MRMKPFPKMLLAFIVLTGTMIGIKSGVEHGLLPTPGTVKAVLPEPTATPGIVQRDGDWNIAQSYVSASGDTTGSPALDKSLRFVWLNAGTLMIMFGVLAGLSIFGSIFVSKLNGGETLNERMRREALEPRRDIHAPFNAPEGMQTQYVSVRTRQ